MSHGQCSSPMRLTASRKCCRCRGCALCEMSSSFLPWAPSVCCVRLLVLADRPSVFLLAQACCIMVHTPLSATLLLVPVARNLNRVVLR
jgi:hypothetical protein